MVDAIAESPCQNKILQLSTWVRRHPFFKGKALETRLDPHYLFLWGYPVGASAEERREPESPQERKLLIKAQASQAQVTRSRSAPGPPALRVACKNSRFLSFLAAVLAGYIESGTVIYFLTRGLVSRYRWPLRCFLRNKMLRSANA